MNRLLLIGIWVCAVTLTSGYATVFWLVGGGSVMKGAEWEGIQYEKTAPINVPMIRDGKLSGYTVVQLVYTADSATLRKSAVPPGLFVVDETFRTIYAADNIDLDHLERYDLATFTKTVREKVNSRMNADVVRDVLVENINYFSRESMRQ